MEVKVSLESTKEQAEELKEFVRCCNSEDCIDLYFAEDLDDAGIMKYFFYENGELVAYFGEVNEYIEGKSFGWSAIHPKYRGKEQKESVIKHIMDKLRKDGKDQLRLVVDGEETYYTKLLESFGGEKKRTSFSMDMNKDGFNPFKEEEKVFFREAKNEDLNSMVEIGMEAFDTEEDEEIDYNKNHLKNDKFQCFVGEHEGKVVGMITATLKGEKVIIGDLAVKEAMRRNGIGGEILSKTIEALIEKNIEEFELGVETKNKNALSLYEKYGFKVQQSYSTYWIEI